MRVAFYAPLKPPDHPVASGDRAMARALIAALRKAGHQVTVASRFRSFDAGDASRQVRLRDLGQALAKRLLRRIEHEARPDLWFTYHLYHKAPDWLGPAISGRLGIPYVLAEASFAPKQAGGLWDIGHRAAADAIRRADRIFQPNPADAECVLPLLDDPERLVLLRPFLETKPFRTPKRKESRVLIGNLFGLDPVEPWLVTVAMMRDDQKLVSYRCLAEALSALTDEPWQLVIAGEGPAEAKVRAAFARFGERVRWVGMLEPDVLKQLYRAADLYLWPAVKEAWGMAFLEAQAAGLPVVAGRSGGVPAIIADRETGLLVAEGDAAAFASAVGKLIAEPKTRAAMGRAAMARAERDHDIRLAADLIDRHIRQLTAEAE
ncbi:MAG: glycosyltransferase family 4 protein [Propylenella sp.]